MTITKAPHVPNMPYTSHRRYARKRSYTRKRATRSTSYKRRKRTTYRRKKYPGKRSPFSAIQSATFIPKIKKIKFSVHFNLSNITGVLGGSSALLNRAYFYANSPFQPGDFHTAHWILESGVWSRSALGLTTWCTNQNPPAGATGQYRQATCYGSRITVTAIPNQQSGSTSDTYADVTNLFVTKSTTNPWATRTTINQLGPERSTASNATVLAMLPNTKRAQLHTNPNGAPKGAKITMDYSYKAMNAIKTRSQAMFAADTHPAEADFFGVALVQQRTGDSNPLIDVNIKIDYFCLLGEPNTEFPMTGDIVEGTDP